MNWIKILFGIGDPPSDKELQAALRALCETILVKQWMSSKDEERYEEILRELYSRGIEPEMTLTIPKKEE